MSERTYRTITGVPSPAVGLCFRILFFAFIMAAGCIVCVQAAQFRITSENGAAVPVDETSYFDIYIMPQEGDKLTGGQCTLTVDPAYIELFKDRSYYAADPVFELVERFRVDTDKGIVTFKAFARQPITEKQIFIKVPFRMKKTGSTYISFTSFARNADGKTSPSNPGYFKVVGYDGLEMDPLLMAAVAGENTLLTTGSLENKYKIQKARKQDTDAMAMSLGFTKMETAEKEEDADVIVGFSKQNAVIGLNQWVRLDLVIYKFPEYRSLDGIDVRIKYDPAHLVYTNNLGIPSNSVNIVKSVDDMSLGELKKLAKNLNVEITEVEMDGKKKEAEKLLAEYREAVRAARGIQTTSVLYNDSFGEGSNIVDNRKGEIRLSLLGDFTKDLSGLKYPLTVVPLIFKGIKTGANIPVTLEEAYLPVDSSSKQLIKNALVTIEPKHNGCDQSLPPQLCAGDFRMTGSIAFQIIREREVRKAFLSSLNKQEDVSIAKYKLQQNWNVFLDGSFKNGIRVDGTMRKSPGASQHLDIEMLGSDGRVHFGDFTTTFTGTSRINLKKEINGLEFGYDFGHFTFQALMAESRSQTGEVQLDGDGDIGPYRANAFMAPGSVQIYYPDTGEIIPPGEYSVLYETGDIYFKTPIRQDRKFNVRYEQSTYSISTGSKNAFGLSYKSGRTKKGKDKYKINTAYMLSMAPSGSTRSIFSDSKVFNLDTQVNVEPADCPGYTATNTCVRVNLGNPYILEGSVKVISGATRYTPTSNPETVILGHRSLFSGQIYILYDNGDEDVKNIGLKGSVTIEFSYYNPNIIVEDVVQVLKFVDADTTEGGLPSDMLPGSELVYLSDTQDETAELDNLPLVCFEGKTGDKDDAGLCPGIRPDLDQQEGITYYIETSGDTDYIKFSKDVESNYYGNPTTETKYVLMSYYIAPPELDSGSKFTKTALGIDTHVNVSDNLSFDVQYTRTNSDLASEFTSAEETMIVDTDTRYRNYESKGEICEYVVPTGDIENATGRKLVCKLNNDNISGQGKVLVSMQFCERGQYICKDEDGNDYKCDDKDKAVSYEIYNADNRESDWYTFPCITDPSTGNYIYKSITHNLNTKTDPEFIGVDREQGNLVIYREFDEGEIGGKDMFLVKFGEAFPSEGDRISVSYIYDEVLSEVVDGDAVVLKNSYKYKGFKMNLEKRVIDPYFDTSMSGKVKGNSKETGYIKGDFSLKFLKNWTIGYLTDNSTKKSFSAGKTDSLIETYHKKHNISYSTGRPVWGIKSLSLVHDVKGDSGISGITSANTKLINNLTTNRDYGIKMDLRKLALAVDGGYKVTDIEKAQQVSADTTTVLKNLNLAFSPKSRRGFSLTSAFSRSNVKQTGSRTRKNVYNLSYKPIRYISLKLKFDKNTSRDNDLAETKIDEKNTYTVNLANMYNFTGIKLSFIRNKTSQQVAPTKTDTNTFNFTWNIRKNLKWTPTFTRKVNQTTAAWTKEKERKWTLKYTPRKSKMKLNISWDRTFKDKTTQNLVIPDSASVDTNPDDRNKFTVNLTPTKKIRTTSFYEDQNGSTQPYKYYKLTYNYNASAKAVLSGGYGVKKMVNYPTTEFDIKYAYKYKPGFRIKTNYSSKDQGGTTGVNSINYGFGFTYSVSSRTNFNLDFKKILAKSKSATTKPLEETSFTAGLKSRL